MDTDIGLYYYGARYYNPAIGRFASLDPWEGDLRDPQKNKKRMNDRPPRGGKSDKYWLV